MTENSISMEKISVLNEQFLSNGSNAKRGIYCISQQMEKWPVMLLERLMILVHY